MLFFVIWMGFRGSTLSSLQSLSPSIRVRTSPLLGFSAVSCALEAIVVEGKCGDYLTSYGTGQLCCVFHPNFLDFSTTFSKYHLLDCRSVSMFYFVEYGLQSLQTWWHHIGANKLLQEFWYAIVLKMKAPGIEKRVDLP